MILKVFRDDLLVGILDILASEPFYGFKYDGEYLSSPEALPLSLSLPLNELRFSSEQAQPFFEGLLPEGNARDSISRRLGVSAQSSVRLIQALGRDCAGAISIIGEDEYLHMAFELCTQPLANLYTKLDDGLKNIAQNPRIEIPRLQEDMRLSLAGAQEKIALFHNQNADIENEWYVPVHGMPSTHIIKPGLLEQYYPDITLNEFICLRAAMLCGIQTANVDLLYPETPVLVIQRFDRKIESSKDVEFDRVTRIHQEDFCQASGTKSSFKYEHDGGPGYKKIRDLLSYHSNRPIDDISMFIKMSIFNYLIGNCDAHSKNFSIFHNPDRTVTLTPAYDMISTTIYDGRFGSKLSRNMGMKIGLHENIDKINTDDFMLFSKEIRTNLNQLKSYRDEIISKLPNALNEAAASAIKKGFTNAPDIANRILNGCYKRAEII